MSISMSSRGFLVTSQIDGGYRTYACLDRQALDYLILFLTGRNADSYPLDRRGLPVMEKVLIASGLHVYAAEISNSKLRSQWFEMEDHQEAPKP